MILILLLLFIATPVFANEKISQVKVPAGPFYLGCSKGDHLCDPDEGEPGGVLVEVPEFYIDTQETSVAEFRQCVIAGECARPFDYRRTRYCNYDAPGRDNYPVNCVNWELANQYCGWRGARLAFDVEWEKAARAGSTDAHYWGPEQADCSRVVMDPNQPNKGRTNGCWRDLSWPRSSFEPNSLGLYDMLGGTSEWLQDWYAPNAHASTYAKGQLTGPLTGTLKTIKGGAWDEGFRYQRVSNRFAKPKTGNPDLYGSNGIRCVTPTENALYRAATQ